MKQHNYLKLNNKNFIIRLGIIFFCSVIVMIFCLNDAFLYNSTIAKITNIEENYLYEKLSTDRYSEKYFEQVITAEIQNGLEIGEEVKLANIYGESLVYDNKYSIGNQIFIQKLDNSQGYLTGTITGQKRDQYAALVLLLLVGLLILVGKKQGIFTLISLTANIIAFYYILKLYIHGYNILALTIPFTIIFATVLLIATSGISKKTFVSLISTLITVTIVTIIAAAVLHFGPNVDYDFMEYLAQPYNQKDTNILFISQILVSSLGAVMDIVVTIVSTVNELVLKDPDIEPKTLFAACRGVGDDIIGTMISVILFTNIASCIPIFALSMRNEIRVITIVKYNMLFEISRFMTGSIGIVLSIPVSTFIAIWIYRKRGRKCS